MNWEAIGAISEVVGATAVVITLVYLVVQIRQNTGGIRASAYQTWVAASIAEQSAASSTEVSKAIAAGLFDPLGLSQDNWVQFAGYCHQFIMKIEATYYLGKEGIISESVCEKEYDRAVNYLACAGPSQWWKAGARTQFTDEFVDMIEKRTGNNSGFQIYGYTQGKGFHPQN